MTNGEVYTITEKLNGLFEGCDQRFPAKVNFYITRNVNAFFKYSQSLDQERYRIIQAYGTVDGKTGKVTMSEENREKANRELQELYDLESEIEFKKIPLSWLDGLDFTHKQMQGILFMIEED